MCPLWFAKRSLETMRRTLAALVLALTQPLAVLPVPSAQAQQMVVVRSGETLSEIAERHGVSLSRLMQANGISDADLVVEGQRLTIPGSGSTARASSTPKTAQGTAPYTVKSGETLSEIADRFNTTTERLIQINAIRDPDLVMSGTRLQVPMSAQRSASAAASAPSVNPNASEHLVQPGESLSLIAERYGTSVNRLVALNQLTDPGLVMAGTRLKLRGTPPAPRSTPQPAAQPKPAATAPAPTPKAAQPVTTAASSPPARIPAPAPQTTTAQNPTVPTPTNQAPSVQSPTVQPTPAQPAMAQPGTVKATAAAQPALPQAAAAPVAQAQAQANAVTAASRAQPAVAQARNATATSGPTAGMAQASTAAATTLATATTSATGGSTATAGSVAARATPTRPAGMAPTTGSPTSAKSTAVARPAGDWRSYGPLQVDWSKIQPMGGSYVAPSLNSDGQALYLAVNCTARKINVTSQAGQWRTWENPSKDFEHKLVQDICQANRS